MINPGEFRPDWVQTFSVAQAEHELQNFKFKGAGWYLSGNDSIFVCDSPLAVHHEEPKQYVFHVYNSRNPIEAFRVVANAQVHA
jgi:hypothetical protein